MVTLYYKTIKNATYIFSCKKLTLFAWKRCASAARIICAPKAHKFHTCEAIRIFPVGKAAGSYGFSFYFALRGETLRGLFCALAHLFHVLAQTVENFIVARERQMREAVDRTALLRVQAHLQLRIEPVALFFGVAADAFALLFAVCGSLAELCALLLRCRKDALAPLSRAGSESVSQLLALLLQLSACVRISVFGSG